MLRLTRSTLKVFGSANTFAKYMAISANAFSAALLHSTSPSLSARRAVACMPGVIRLLAGLAITRTRETIPQRAAAG